MSAERARIRFDEFVRAARASSIKAVVYGGGDAMRLKAAAILIAIAVGVPTMARADSIPHGTGESLTVAALSSHVRSSRAESGKADPVKEMLLGMMGLRCPSASMAETIAARNMECRNLRDAGVESSLHLIPDAELLGELDRLPVFLSPSARPYVNHVESRGGNEREWVPMLVISRGMAQALLPLPEAERKAAVAFLLGREKELMRSPLDEVADFCGFQRALFSVSDLASAQAGIEAALRVEAMPSNSPGAMRQKQRESALRGHFQVAREMAATNSHSVERPR